jgi:fatty acid desaturase
MGTCHEVLDVPGDRPASEENAMANAHKMNHRSSRRSKSEKPNPRRAAGVALWALGIAAGIFGGDYGLLVALALVAAGFVLFMSNPGAKR